jgi:hypothetical protein
LHKDVSFYGIKQIRYNKKMLEKIAETLLLETQEQEQKQTVVKPFSLLAKLGKRPYFVDILIVAVMALVLLWGARLQIQFYGLDTDAARYQCYIIAFTQGTSALSQLPAKQCSLMSTTARIAVPQTVIVQDMKAWRFPEWLVNFVASQSGTQPFRVLPHEYPFLTLVPFLLGMTGPPQWYQIIFAFWMIALAVGSYFLVKRFFSRGAAFALALYLAIGGWVTVGGRFDLIPALFTFIALLCAQRAKWKWAFVMLAFGTLFKFYPLVLVLPFFIAQQRERNERWYSWRRLDGLFVFAAVCLGVEIISLLLSVQGTLAPFSYFGTRPIQVESLSASLLWLSSFFHMPLTFVYSYGSLNVSSPLSSIVSVVGLLALIVGLGYTFWLQWRGKLPLAQATLLTLLIVMLTGKVFSPQYLIWIVPFVAIVGKSNWKWLLCWGTICFLTTLIYPFLYALVHNILLVPLLPIFYPVVTARNVLVLSVVIALFYQANHPRPKAVLASSGNTERR